MKTFILLLVFILPVSLSGQWNLIYNHGDQENAIAVLNNNTVIAVTNSGGRVHRTTDGGNNWTFYQTVFTQSWFLDVHFPSPQVGYACGGSAFGLHKNVIIKTTDGGVTWDSLTSNFYPGYSFNKIHFLNTNTGFVAGDNQGMLKTTDGGQTFNPITFPEGGVVTAINFPSPQNGFVATNKYLSSNNYIFSILKTNDQGSSWNKVYTDTVYNMTTATDRRINVFHFVNPAVGYAAGGSGLFLRSTNAGLSWSTSTVAPGSELNTIWMTSTNSGYMNIAGGISKSINGTLSWSQQSLTPPTPITQIVFANDSIGYAVGNAGIYKTKQTDISTAINGEMKKDQIQLFPNPCKDYFYIKAEGAIKKVVVYDISGRSIKMFAGWQLRYGIQELCEGHYILQIDTGKNILFKKLVIEP